MYHKIADTPAQKYCSIDKKSQKLNILIVDDDENSRNALKDILSCKCNVATLDEGLKCINRCNEIKFDMIFMDFHIDDLEGDLDGTDVSKLLQECFDMKNTMIFAYTGDNSTAAIQKFKDSKMNGAFIKPVSYKLINEFLSIVEKNFDVPHQLTKLSIKCRNFLYFLPTKQTLDK